MSAISLKIKKPPFAVLSLEARLFWSRTFPNLNLDLSYDTKIYNSTSKRRKKQWNKHQIKKEY